MLCSSTRILYVLKLGWTMNLYIYIYVYIYIFLLIIENRTGMLHGKKNCIFFNICGLKNISNIPGRAVLSYMEIIYPWYTGECKFLNRLNLFFPS
jgi:hypothetical protein